MASRKTAGEKAVRYVVDVRFLRKGTDWRFRKKEFSDFTSALLYFCSRVCHPSEKCFRISFSVYLDRS